MRCRRLGLATIAMASLLLCWSGVAMAQTLKRGGTLRIAYGNEVAHLDFHTAPGYEMMWVAMNLGCGLVNITPDGQFVGDAAQSWEVSPDGLTYTFKLHDNVLFHDGTTVDAAAVKFSIDHIVNPETKSGMKTFYDAVERVEVVDPLTARVHMKHPNAFFLHMLGGYRTGLVFYRKSAEDHGRKAVGECQKLKRITSSRVPRASARGYLLAHRDAEVQSG